MDHDRAGKEYWDESWQDITVPHPIIPSELRWYNYNDYTNLRFHKYFSKLFSELDTQGLKLLEIGCARSAWLPYFAQQFGFNVCGIDYSAVGCQQARQILSNAGVNGEVVCADFFSPPHSLIGVFDLVVSFGVAEHFEDTKACLIQFSKFIKPGGILITIIPNLTGWLGFLQKTFNRRVYEIHLPLTEQEFYSAHLQTQMKVIECKYFMSQSLALINLNGLKPKTLGTRIKILAQFSLLILTQLIWFLEDSLKQLPITAFFSPYIICVAQKDVRDIDI